MKEQRHYCKICGQYKMKKIILLFIVLILILISGCNEKNTATKYSYNDDTKDSQEMTVIEETGMKYVFGSKRIMMPAGSLFYTADYFDRSFVLNDRIYFAMEFFDKSVKYGYAFAYFYSYDFNGENEELLLINPINENAEIKFMWYDSEYNLIIIEEFDYQYTMTRFDVSGEIIFSFELNDIVDSSAILSMVIGDENENIYIATSDNKVTVFSKDGEISGRISTEYNVIQLSSALGKTPILKTRDSNGSVKFQYVILDSLTLKDIEMPHTMLDYRSNYVFYGKGHDYYHVSYSFSI